MHTLPETHLTSIPLFDKSAANDASGCVFLCSPKRMYGTPFYDNLERRLKKLHPNALILSARGMYLNSQEWRETYREKLARIEACYTLMDLRGYIGAGQFAELAYMISSPKHPLRRHVAARPFIDAILCNRLKLVTEGRFEAVEDGDFWCYARFTQRRKAPVESSPELPLLRVAA